MNKAIIIGSGIAGLATAARLLSKGYDVSIFEAGEVTGGKIHSFNLGEYRFDAGPSLFTLPYLVDELFENAPLFRSWYQIYPHKSCTQVSLH